MIYDITQPLLECVTYPGDFIPEKKMLHRIEDGEAYNMTQITLSVHNGTHVDAPCHFLKDGKDICEIPPEKFAGPAFVVSHEGEVGKQDALEMLEKASAACEEARKRILIRGNAVVTEEAAQVFASAGIWLAGNESQAVGPLNAPMAVHPILLKAEVVLLEGIRLTDVPDGVYFLVCLPLKLSGSDGSPCRAVLMDMKDDAPSFI